MERILSLWAFCKNPSTARGTQPPIFRRRCASSCRIAISFLANTIPVFMVHGDEFISCGRRDAVSWFKPCLEARFEVKTSMIGHGPNDASEGRVLHRIIRATIGVWEYEGDQRHAELIVQSLNNLEKSKPVTTPEEGGGGVCVVRCCQSLRLQANCGTSKLHGTGQSRHPACC